MSKPKKTGTFRVDFSIGEGAQEMQKALVDGVDVSNPRADAERILSEQYHTEHVWVSVIRQVTK